MTRVPIPGRRDVTATLDAPNGADGQRRTGGPDEPGESGETAVSAPVGDSDGATGGDAWACVVACPPHPQFGGSRSDRRLRAVADDLVERGVACLRFDYGPWDGGRGEQRDAGAALDWAGARYDAVGLFGYSFGGAVALAVAADRPDLGAVVALAPAAGLDNSESGNPVDTVAALDRVAVPTLVVYGERDDTVEWERVVERARAAGHAVESVAADHHFVGQHRAVARRVGEFFAANLGSA